VEKRSGLAGRASGALADDRAHDRVGTGAVAEMTAARGHGLVLDQGAGKRPRPMIRRGYLIHAGTERPIRISATGKVDRPEVENQL
jgi:hypothetical protein